MIQVPLPDFIPASRAHIMVNSRVQYNENPSLTSNSTACAKANMILPLTKPAGHCPVSEKMQASDNLLLFSLSCKIDNYFHFFKK